MVSKTRSQNKMAGDEGVFDARSEIATIREEMAELKGMRTEMSEIKLLLKKLCPPEPDGATTHPGTSKVNVSDSQPTNFGDNERWGTGGMTRDMFPSSTEGKNITVKTSIEFSSYRSLLPLRDTDLGMRNLPGPTYAIPSISTRRISAMDNYSGDIDGDNNKVTNNNAHEVRN